MNSNAAIYEKMIQNAKAGDDKAEKFLRRRLWRMSETMSLPLLLSISELILEHRREELRNDAALN
jgi:hypothetical protein